jgi:adenylosuccinate lyase
LSVFAGLGGTLEKFATEIRHLQRTEVGEVEEPFDPGNQGSSAMPHKRNPHASERMAGLARLLRGYAATAMENNALWHERDISHSSAERVIFPDAAIVLDFMIAEVSDVLARLAIYPERMRDNLEATGGLIYSQRVLLALVEAGMDRQVAYKLVQEHAQHAMRGGPPFRQALSADERIAKLIDAKGLAALFDPATQLRHLGEIFARLGLEESATENHQHDISQEISPEVVPV